MKFAVFCDMKPHSSVQSYVRFWVTYCLHLHDRLSILKVKAPGCSETFATVYQITRRHMPENSNVCGITMKFLEYGEYDEFNALWLLCV
jgi:hypothetical protein